MGTIRTTIAALLTTLSLAAFQSDAFAQARRGGESRSSSVSRSSSSSRKSTAVKPSSQSRQPKSSSARPARRTARPSSSARPSGNTAVRPEPQKPAGRPASTDNRVVRQRPAGKPAVRPNDKPSGKPGGPGDRPGNKPGVRPGDKPRPGGPDRPHQIRPGHKPGPHRIHPRDRDFMAYDRPSHYWKHHGHCFGHRVRVLPSHCVRYHYHGHTYYCYNDVWYRPYGSYYIVCRPPFGTVLAAALVADMAWDAVNYSYYNTVQNTYEQINENNRYIAEQNAVIAQNNATLAAQNQAVAMNQQLAAQAYTLANELGLVQSYAAANSSYYYQDGIFYMTDASGEYRTIVPPAGALVETLPDDYDIVTLKGDEYYKVDDTVYKITIKDGKPYFEVLGQM